jgi:transposase-like protein
MSEYRKIDGGRSFLGTQRSGGERSEPERSGGPKNEADFSPPAPEVSDRPIRRRFSAKYKLKIVQEADHCDKPGQIGALLRREGLYSSQLTAWRKLRDQGALHGLSSKKRGPKPPPQNPQANEMKQLQKEISRLQKKLARAEAIIDFQKKVHALLGTPLEEMDPEENP